jgi:hypothetical protein
VHEERLGRIKAAVWENETENGVRHNVTICRLYKDGDKWKDTTSFGRDDLPLVAKVADRAHTWILPAGRRRRRIGMSGVETLLADLECVIQELSDRVTALTAAIDELSDEIQWRKNHARDSGEPPRPFVLTSMPLDPCAEDWRINRVERDGSPKPEATQRSSAGKGTLFE